MIFEPILKMGSESRWSLNFLKPKKNLSFSLCLLSADEPGVRVQNYRKHFLILSSSLGNIYQGHRNIVWSIVDHRQLDILYTDSFQFKNPRTFDGRKISDSRNDPSLKWGPVCKSRTSVWNNFDELKKFQVVHLDQSALRLHLRHLLGVPLLFHRLQYLRIIFIEKIMAFEKYLHK